MAEEIFDFGFTLVDEDELDTVQEIEQKVSETSSTVEATQENLINYLVQYNHYLII